MGVNKMTRGRGSLMGDVGTGDNRVAIGGYRVRRRVAKRGRNRGLGVEVAKLVSYSTEDGAIIKLYGGLGQSSPDYSGSDFCLRGTKPW
nr:hypothetical protein CFP56_46479 [Quercus suber]